MRRRSSSWSRLCLIWLLTFLGCGRFLQRDVRIRREAPFPRKLSEWRLFSVRSGRLEPNKGVVPYDLNTPLFSDYASKYRFVWMPPGSSAQYEPDNVFDFPVGTVLTKTFSFPAGDGSSERLIETRLLVHTNTNWIPLLYIWDADQHDAIQQLVPDPVRIHRPENSGPPLDFAYRIPNVNECHECHDNNKVFLPIGPKARNLNKNYTYPARTENQLTYWARIGFLQGLPAPDVPPRVAKWDDPESGSLEARARAYLDNNCAHCHEPGGQAGYTGVDFRLAQTEFASLGICKSPNAAGEVGALRYDIIPGRPDESILIYRLESTAPKTSMPPLSRDVVHVEGVKLVREWIESLPGRCRGVGGGSNPR